MAVNVVMPKLGFIMTEGTVLEWLKKPGDPVSKGELLLKVETDKVIVEVESPGTGILGPKLAPPGITVPVATLIGYILGPGESASPELDAEIGKGQPAQAVEPETVSRVRERKEAPREQRVMASPPARKLAQQHGIDLGEITGSGPQGRIVEKDVLAYLESRPAPAPQKTQRVSPLGRKLASEMGVDINAIQGTGPTGRVMAEDVRRASQAAAPQPGPEGETVELSRVQRITAERMALSFSTAPHFYLNVQADLSLTVEMRESLLPSLEAKTGLRLSYSDILVYVVAQALREHPQLNSTFEENRIRRFKEINVGLAVDTPHGLTVPVLSQADRMSLEEIARRRTEIVDRAQNDRLTYQDVSGGTFTISNLGMFGVDVFNAIINPPQAAILAVGRIAKRPVEVDGVLQLRPTLWLSLSVDHRVADGAAAARFLQTVVRYLEEPSRLKTPPE